MGRPGNKAMGTQVWTLLELHFSSKWWTHYSQRPLNIQLCCTRLFTGQPVQVAVSCPSSFSIKSRHVNLYRPHQKKCAPVSAINLASYLVCCKMKPYNCQLCSHASFLYTFIEQTWGHTHTCWHRSVFQSYTLYNFRNICGKAVTFTPLIKLRRKTTMQVWCLNPHPCIVYMYMLYGMHGNPKIWHWFSCSRR